jgi:hypothetical protein
MLTFARERGGEFIYMNDDFYITPKLRADIPIHIGEFELNPRHPSHYREAMFNTIEFLKYYNRPLWNFETHSPVLMDSDKLLEIFELIEWQRYNHFIKSIYPERKEGNTYRMSITHESLITKVVTEKVEDVPNGLLMDWHLTDTPYVQSFWDANYPLKN